jgi:hypothetical protein
VAVTSVRARTASLISRRAPAAAATPFLSPVPCAAATLPPSRMAKAWTLLFLRSVATVEASMAPPPRRPHPGS